MVFDTIRNSIFAGLGLMVVTGEQIRRTVNSLVEAGKITAEQGETLINDITQRSREQAQGGQGLQDRVNEMVRRGLDNFDIGSRREFQSLESRVKSLEDRLSVLEAIKLREMRSEDEKRTPAGSGSSEFSL